MIIEYHRPISIESALALLSRTDPVTIPLGGGTVLSRKRMADCAVVDLQLLNLNVIEEQGGNLHIGATTTLQNLVNSTSVPPYLVKIVEREANYNLRQASTVGGTIAANDGRSGLLTALLAADANLRWLPGERWVRIGEWLPVRNEWKHGLIDQVQISLGIHLGYEQVGRSPADQPIISVAVAKWPSGRIRIAIGGDLPLPLLAADGAGGEALDEIVKIAYSHYRNPKYSKQYIQETTKSLILRLLDQVKGG